MSALIALAAGLLFGLGLAISGMIDPARVLGFLDVAGGSWDPTLALVMIGALGVMLPGTAWVKRRGVSWLGPLALPSRQDIDAKLLLGAGFFGVGWGMAGFCPGPALAALGPALWPAALFVAAMIAGMLAHHLTLGRSGGA